LESAERVAQIGSWEWTPETGELLWSDNLFRLFGLEPGSTTPSVELVREMTHADDRELQERELAPRAKSRPSSPFRKRSFSGSPSIRASRTCFGGLPTHWTAWSGFFGCQTARSWSPASWRKRNLDKADDFEAATRRLRIARGQGLPGSVWKSGTPIALNDLRKFQGYLRTEEAKTAGLRGGVAFAVLDGEEVLAVVELYSCESAEPSERLMRSLVGIGHQLGQFLKRHWGELGSARLTPRELEILQLAARGNSAAQIAERLTISRSTVKTHFEHVYAKLEVPDRVAAVAKAVRSGLVE
jgi:DNA-binding CsgD family transcriptional regulator